MRSWEMVWAGGNGGATSSPFNAKPRRTQSRGEIFVSATLASRKNAAARSEANSGVIYSVQLPPTDSTWSYSRDDCLPILSVGRSARLATGDRYRTAEGQGPA